MEENNKKKWVAISVYLTPQNAKKLKQKAEQEKRSISAQAQILIENAL